MKILSNDKIIGKEGIQNDFVGDYTVFDLMILDANTYIAQLNFSYFILRTWKSKYHCKEVKYSLEEKGLL